MPCCDTGRNIQKYKGAAASTLQDALENGNTASLNINLSSPAVFIGDGGGLSNINASAVAGNLQAVTDNGAATTNKITLTNGLTSLVTSGNVLVTGNVTASFFRGDGGTLSNIAANKNFQEVTDLGATSSNKITLTNSATSLQTTGKIVSLTLEANVNASNIVTNDGRGINQLNASNVSIGTLAISRGGTGAGSASAAASALGVGTEDSPQFTAIELGHASDTTLARSSAGVVTIEGVEIRTGTVPVAKGGTGATSASAAASALGVGTEDSPQFTAIKLGHASDTTLARSSAGVVTIGGVEIRTGTVPVAKGGTGATTLDNLITMGTHTTGDFVGTITGGNGITSTAGTTGEDTDHTLSIDAKANGGLVFESGKLAVDLDASSITGTLAVSDGGTGATTLDNLITMGTHTTGDFVGTITGGNGITSTAGTTGEDTDHTLSIDAKANGGLVFESGKLAVDLDASSITGTLAVSDGGTGATTLDNLITMGTHTTGDFVGTITGGNGITSTAGTTGEDTDHTLSIDAKSNGGLVFESGKLAVDLDASSITGTLAVSDGGTGHDSYVEGQILMANTVNGSVTLTKLTPGTTGHFLKSQGAGSHLEWASVAEIGSATPGQLIMGDYLTGGPTTLAEDTTIAADATTTNTVNKLVARDGSGDIFVQNLYTAGGIELGHASDTTLARSSAGVVTIEGVEIRTGTVPVAKGGTGATSASAAASALGVGTEDSPQFTAIELGHASDTTLARSSAGVVTIEGAEIRTGTVPIGKGGTGQTTASAAASALGVGTEDSPQFTAIELGHASDTTLARDSAGVVTIEGAEIRTGTVPIGKGGTGQTTASAAASALGVGTEDSPQFTAIELGHATDTTLARSSAGVVTIEGAEIRTGTVARGDGGTGQTSYSTGDILYGASSGTTLNKLSPAGSNADVGKFLKLGDGDEPEWATVSVSSTTISTTDVTIEDTDHGLIFVSDSGTGVQALKKEYGTLKYKPSTGTLTTSNVITSDTSIHARNGIANTTPTHTLSVGTVVSIQETASGDVIIVRGNGYFSDEVYIAKKLTVPVGGEILADKITVRSLETKGSIVFANRPPTSGIVLG
jgi:hypothetical protein